MIKVIIKKEDHSESELLILTRILTSIKLGYSIIDIENSKLKTYGGNNEILIIHGDLKDIDTNNSIIITRKLEDVKIENYKLKKPSAIIYQNDLNESTILEAESSVNYISCGFSDNDLFTFSSFEQESAVVCLKQRILTLKGNFYEPSEVPITYKSKPDSFSLLASTAVLYLLDIHFTLQAIKI